MTETNEINNGDALRAQSWDEYVGQTKLKARLDIHIQSARKSGRMLPHVLLAGPAGFGKGHPLGTKVLTPAGWMTIGELSSGSEIIGSDGKATIVTDVYDRGVLDTYEVTFSDGATTLCDGDHLWAIYDSRKRHYVRSTRELLTNTHDSHGSAKWRIPTVAPVQHPAVDLPIEPYLLGVLLANGFLDGTPCVYTDDVEIITNIRSRNPQLKITQTTSQTSTSGRWSLHGLRESLRSLGLYGIRSAKKSIPTVYLTASEPQRRALLAGLMDCDGGITAGKSPRYYTSSSLLVEGIRELVESLGGITHTRLYDYPDRPGQEWNVGITTPSNPFLLERKATQWKPVKFSRRIVDIRHVGQTEIRCIRVSAADHLYVTERHVVTHNTTLAQIIARQLQDDFKMIKMSAALSPRAIENILRSWHGGVLFLDEIHAATKAQQEDLLTLLEDGYITLKNGRRLEHKAITIIAATTEPEKLIKPLHDRFTLKPSFDSYNDEDMTDILLGMAGKLGMDLEDKLAMGLARATGGTPRLAKQFVLSARALKDIGYEVSVEAVLDLLDMDEDGLTREHMTYLEALDELGGIAGLDKLANMTRLHLAIISDLERLLVERNFITYGATGRELTQAGTRKVRGLSENIGQFRDIAS